MTTGRCLATAAVAALALALGACGGDSPTSATTNTKELEVVSWWTSGSEAAALETLFTAFRKANPVIGRNLERATAAEATLMNPASTPEQRLEAVRLWAYDLKALSPYDGMNQGENGKFLRFREVSVTYNVPSVTAGKFGFSHLSLTAAARNIALWTPYSGVDPEINEFGRGGASGDLGGIDQNFGEGIDAFGFALPRRFTFTVRLGF